MLSLVPAKRIRLQGLELLKCYPLSCENEKPLRSKASRKLYRIFKRTAYKIRPCNLAFQKNIYFISVESSFQMTTEKFYLMKAMNVISNVERVPSPLATKIYRNEVKFDFKGIVVCVFFWGILKFIFSCFENTLQC